VFDGIDADHRAGGFPSGMVGRMQTPPLAPHVARLGPADVDSAWPLARMAFGGLTLSAWRRRARRWTQKPDGGCGVLLARDPRGRLIGLAPFQVRHPLGAPRTLSVEAMVTLSLIDNQPAADALVGELARLASSLGCPRLELTASNDSGAARAAMAARPAQGETTLLHCRV
jgi:hypothetical protein